MANGVTAVGMLTYAPVAYAAGHDWWNLRNLEFRHYGVTQMADATVGLCFTPSNAGALTVGYRYQRYSPLASGVEDLSQDISWNKATNIQKGLYISGLFKF